MSSPAYTPKVGGDKLKGWYGGARRSTIVERVQIADGNPRMFLAQKLPPRSRIIWASLNNITAVTNVSTGDGTNTATGYSLIRFGTDTTTNSLSTGTASSVTNILLLTTNTSSNTTTNNTQAGLTQPVPTNTTPLYNSNTTQVFLALIPSVSSSNRISYNTTGTVGFWFGTSTQINTVPTSPSTVLAGTVDVYVHIEEYVDQVSA